MTRLLLATALLASPAALASNDHDAAISRIKSAIGTEDYDDAVTQALTAEYDFDGDGSIDTGKEIKAISCDVWRAIDEGVQAQWSSGARVIYGFKKGFIWVGYAFGIDEKMRKLSDKVMAGCGLPD